MANSVLNYSASRTGAKFHKSKAFVRGIMGPFGCLPGHTEFLSPTGWVRLDEYNDELVASYNPITGEIKYEAANYVKRAATEWVEFRSKTRFKLTMSEDHYMPVTRRLHRYEDKDDSLIATELARLEGHKQLWHHYKVPARANPISDDLIRYAVAVNADGHLPKCSPKAVVFGFTKQRKIDRLLGLLNRLELAYTHNKYTHKGKPYETIRVKDSPYRAKTFTGSFWWKLGGPELNVVIDELPYWDGTWKGPDKTVAVFTTTREQDVPFIQHAAAASNHRATVGVEIKKGCNPQYCLNLIQRSSKKGSVILRRDSITTTTKQSQPGDSKYCFETSTGFFIIRQNNQVLISQNSGKSVACCWEIFMKAKAQAPCSDGIRRSRWIVARNTQPQLETTTIKTWLDWFPEEIFGKMSRKPPFTHLLKIGDIELEVIFLALDRPEDLKKLLSFEVTGVWFNEAREMDYELIAGATGRVGRYPSKKFMPAEHVGPWPTWHGIIMDTNPPNDEHWWYKMDVEQAWAVDDFGHPKAIEEIEPNKRWEFFKQPGGLSDEAENLDNLPGGRDYYLQQLGGKSKEWIKVHVHGEYGSVTHGLPVYGDNYQPAQHRSELDIPIMPSGKIFVGVDCSGRHPAALFAQRNMLGQLQIVHELCITEDQGLGAKNFARLLKQEMGIVFPNHNFEVFGDPAGQWGSQNDEQTYFSILHSEGIFVKTTPDALRIKPRIEAVMHLLCSFPGGRPAIIISPTCKHLIRGMEGGYRYKKLNVSGGVRYDEKPEKNRYSDIQDALQYLVCGTGGMNRLFGREGKSGKTSFAKSQFNIF